MNMIGAAVFPWGQVCTVLSSSLYRVSNDPYLLHDGLKHEAIALIIHAFLQGHIHTVVLAVSHPYIFYRACMHAHTTVRPL